jgi:hypothetical protein
LLHSRYRKGPGWKYVSLEPSSRFIAKNQLARDGSTALQPIVIPSLSHTLSQGMDEDKKLCPVRALRWYLKRTEAIRGKRELLFISHWPGCTTDIKRGTISSWIVQCIRMCLQSCSEETAKHASVRAHDVRALAASWAFKSGIALDDVMKACSWRAHNTFTSHYLWDIALSDPQGRYSLGPVVAAQTITQLK